jgi:hypothetical protein
MKVNQFADQCEPDSRPLGAAGTSTFDVMKALEQARQFLLGDPGAGVAND